MGQKHDQGSTCLAQSAAGPVPRGLDLDVAPRTADRLSHQTRTYKQTSTKDKKQYTKQYEQYKTRLLNYVHVATIAWAQESSKTDLKRESYG